MAESKPLLPIQSNGHPKSASSSSAMSSSLYRSINADVSDDPYHRLPSHHHTPGTRHDADDLFATPSSELSPSSSSASLPISQSSSFSHTPHGGSGGGTATIPALTFTLSNTILGAGVLGIAHAVSTSGYVLGLALLLFAAFASAFGLHLLASSARTLSTSPASFYTVAHGIIPSATPLIDAALVVKCFGVATSYLIVIGDLMPTAIATLFPAQSGHQAGTEPSAMWTLLADRRTWISVFMVAIALPLSCLRSLNALRFTSTISICFVSILSITVVLYSLFPDTFPPCGDGGGDDCKGSTANFSFTLDTAKVFPVFIFAFTCAQNIFTVYNELRDNSQTRVTTTIGSAILLALFFYTVISIFAYHTFGDRVTSNILTAYPSSLPLAVVRVLIAVNVAFTFPLQVNPCRNSLHLLIQQARAKWGEGGGRRKSLSGSGSADMPRWLLMSLSGSICGLAWMVAFFVDDLGVVLGIVGATGSTLISYILPGLFYWSLHRERTVQRWLAGALCGWGLLVVPVCLTLIFMGASGH